MSVSREELAAFADGGLEPARMAEVAAAIAGEIGLHKSEVKMKGPMPCAINRIAGYHRVQILLFAAGAGPLQRVLAGVRKEKGILSNDRIGVDVDPVSLL